MVERGVIVGTTRLIKRVWQIYIAHVLLFVVYLAEIGYLAQKYGVTNSPTSSTSAASCPTRP
jgi:OpgC protein